MYGTVPGLERIRVSVSGGPLPSARLVSSVIHSNRDSDLTSITHMVMQWGQFLDHDLTCKYFEKFSVFHIRTVINVIRNKSIQ